MLQCIPSVCNTSTMKKNSLELWKEGLQLSCMPSCIYNWFMLEAVWSEMNSPSFTILHSEGGLPLFWPRPSTQGKIIWLVRLFETKVVALGPPVNCCQVYAYSYPPCLMPVTIATFTHSDSTKPPLVFAIYLSALPTTQKPGTSDLNCDLALECRN